jgi:hypothetical protein
MVDPCPVAAQAWWNWYPPVGMFIAVLAAVSVIVPWLGGDKLGRGWKIFWSFLFVALVGLELRSIKLDAKQRDRDQARAECEQLEGFKETANGIEASNQLSRDQFVATMKRFEDTINTETGGNTFCYTDFSVLPMLEDGKPTGKANVWLDAVKVGNYPLRDVNVTLFDQTKNSRIFLEMRKEDTKNFTIQAGEKVFEEMREAERQSTTVIDVGGFATGHKSLGAYALTEGDSQNFDVFIRLFNRPSMIERVSLRQTGGHWFKAILVEVPEAKDHYWATIDRDFPRKNGHLDVAWPRLANGRDGWDH